MHPQFNGDGTKLLFAGPERHGVVNPWEWWTQVVADFDIATGQASNLEKTLPRVEHAFYETHQFFDDGSFLFSFAPGKYPRGAYRFIPGKGTSPIYTPKNGDWVEHAYVLPDGRMLLNSSNGLWNPSDGVRYHAVFVRGGHPPNSDMRKPINPNSIKRLVKKMKPKGDNKKHRSAEETGDRDELITPLIWA